MKCKNLTWRVRRLSVLEDEDVDAVVPEGLDGAVKLLEGLGLHVVAVLLDVPFQCYIDPNLFQLFIFISGFFSRITLGCFFVNREWEN